MFWEISCILSALVAVAVITYLLLFALHKSGKIFKPIEKICYSPDCITESKKHIIEQCWDSPFYASCTACFERFVLVSETALKQMEITVKPKRR